MERRAAEAAAPRGEYKIFQNTQPFQGSTGDEPATEQSTSYSSHNPTLPRNLAFDSWHSGGEQAIDLSDPGQPTQADEVQSLMFLEGNSDFGDAARIDKSAGPWPRPQERPAAARPPAFRDLLRRWPAAVSPMARGRVGAYLASCPRAAPSGNTLLWMFT